MGDPVVAQLMRGLVSRLGGQLAAAHVTAQRSGSRPDPADISRKVNGSRAWTIDDMVALQEAVGRSDVTDYLALAAAAIAARPHQLVDVVAVAAKEHGECVSAAVSLADDADEADLAAAVVEAREAHRATADVLSALEARLGAARDGDAVPLPRRSA